MKITETVNYSIFRFAYSMKGMLLKSVPQKLVPMRTNLNGVLQIAITTYVDRYESFFKPLYKSLRRVFPDISLYVAVNGFHDKSIQDPYLERFHNELCTDDMGLGTFILHDKPVGLTRLWNELLSQGNCKTTLVLNDDLKIYPWFRAWIEKRQWNPSITLINGSWSHFFLNKEVLNYVGWFDENFRGIGFEDMDYTARCVWKGVLIDNLSCQYIRHLNHQPSRTSFDNQSSTLWGPKYSSINHDTFFQKWKVCDYDSGIFIKQLNAFVIPNKVAPGRMDELELKFENRVYYPDRH
jgi:hypothetical protein